MLQLLGPSTGGIRLHVAELSRRLPDLGWRVSVAGPAGVMDGLLPAQERLDVPPAWVLPAFRRSARRLEELCDGIDVLHVHGSKAMRVAMLARRRPPTVLTVHNLVDGTQPGPLVPVLRRLERRVVRAADELIVINDEMERRFTGTVAPGRVSFVLPASPPRVPGEAPDAVRRRLGVAPDAPLVVVVARHHRQKNLGMFLEAVHLARRDLPALRAVLVGDGPERAALEARADRLGLRDVVVFAGQRPNPADEMCAADVVALSSDWEGSALVVAECLRLGRPLVTTAVGTVTRLLRDREHARVTPIGDPQAFAAALVETLRDRDGALAMGVAGSALAATTFDPDVLVGLVERVYRRAVEDNRRQPHRGRATPVHP